MNCKKFETSVLDTNFLYHILLRFWWVFSELGHRFFKEDVMLLLETPTKETKKNKIASSENWAGSVQSLSCVQLCDPMNCSTPGLPVHSLCFLELKFWTSRFVHHLASIKIRPFLIVFEVNTLKKIKHIVVAGRPWNSRLSAYIKDSWADQALKC